MPSGSDQFVRVERLIQKAKTSGHFVCHAQGSGNNGQGSSPASDAAIFQVPDEIRGVFSFFLTQTREPIPIRKIYPE